MSLFSSHGLSFWCVHMAFTEPLIHRGCAGWCPVLRWGAYSAPQTPSCTHSLGVFGS